MLCFQFGNIFRNVAGDLFRRTPRVDHHHALRVLGGNAQEPFLHAPGKGLPRALDAVGLAAVLHALCRVLLRMGNAYMNAGLNESVEITVDFDDSIIEDKETDFNRDSRMVQMGIMNHWEFRAKWMNEDEATAKAALPQMESLLSGDE